MRAAILQAITDDLAQATGHSADQSKGGAGGNEPTLIDKPVRSGKAAFKHSVSATTQISELTTMPAARGGTYWYGWSMQLPDNFDHRSHSTTVMQLVSLTPRRTGELPCGGNGSFLRIDAKGRLVFHLQHAGEGAVSKCDEFVILDDIAKAKGRWIDFVMHAKWTGDDNGVVELWAKVHDNNFIQRVGHRGRTWWNDEDKGPIFKLGMQIGASDAGGPTEMTLYTDEFRLGDSTSSFDEVAPPGDAVRAAEAGRGQVRYVLYPSLLNRSKIAIMVYTPPGYDSGATRRYPVVYNLHGAGGGSPARQWVRTQKTLTQAMESEVVPPVIVVFVNGLGDTGYIDAPGSSSPKVFSSIVTELIPFVDAQYRTIGDRRGRAIDGFSMGGGGAMMIATKRPDLFSSVVSYGGAFMRVPPSDSSDPRDVRRRELMEQFAPWSLVRRNLEAIRTGLRVRMVCGDQDSLHPLNVEFKDFLATVNIPVSWVSIPGVAHDTTGLYNRVGVESFKFMHEGFASP